MADFIDTMSGWLDIVFTPIVKNIIVAVIILLIGFVIGRIVGKVSKKFFREIQLNKIARMAVAIPFDIDSSISYFLEYLIYFITVGLALQTLNITKIVLYIALAVVVIFFLMSLILGVRDFLPNLIATLLLRRKGSLKKGDRINADGAEGTIENIGIVKTQVRTGSGDTLFIPNITVLKNSKQKRHLKRKID